MMSASNRGQVAPVIKLPVPHADLSREKPYRTPVQPFRVNLARKGVEQPAAEPNVFDAVGPSTCVKQCGLDGLVHRTVDSAIP